VSGVSQAIPVLGPLFPAVVGADLLMLTKNQVMMLLRLAAIYDQSLDVRDRLREVVAVIGGGFGWRGLARGSAALLPGPLALGLKVTLAYAGTYVVGRAAQVVLDEGRQPTRQELQRICEDSARLARETAAQVLEEVGKLGRSVRDRCLPDRSVSIREAVVAEQAALVEGSFPGEESAPEAGAAEAPAGTGNAAAADAPGMGEAASDSVPDSAP
jgi:uncharacterized protein (DUF697 family)